MTEAEWMTWRDPEAMIREIQIDASDRQLQLLTIATARLRWDELPEDPFRKVVETAERYADDAAYATFLELNVFRDQVFGFITGGERGDRWWGEPNRSWLALTLLLTARDRNELPPVGDGDVHLWQQCIQGSSAALCLVVRDIFGNPFRPVAFSPEWRTSTTVLLAQQMYESRDFGAMPILADALQDAGCDNDDVLTHCRGTGPHVRGCWVVDHVLGKE